MNPVGLNNVTPLRPGPPLPPPHQLLRNHEAEQSLLGILMLDNRAYEHVVDLVKADDFYHGVHGRIYAAIEALVGRGEVANPITLRQTFDRDEALENIGGARYLADLAASAGILSNVAHYAGLIADLARRRAVVNAAKEMIADASALSDPLRSADDVLDAAEQRLFEIVRANARHAVQSVGKVAQEAITDIDTAYRAGGIRIVNTGLTDLDEKISGIGPGELVILGGRPGQGKTALASTIAFNAARDGKKSLLFSLEMTKRELAQRWIAGLTGIETDRQRHGKVEPQEWDALTEAQTILAKMPIYVDDQARLSVAQMRQRARRIKRRVGLDLIIVDHIQLIRQGGKTETRALELADATSSLKAIAKELDVPILALSQLNRGVEQREDKRPMLADLRESGAIEQDADVVMFIFRQEYYLKRHTLRRRPTETAEAFSAREADWQSEIDRWAGLAEIIVDKNRHGRIGTVRVAWHPERQRFDNLARGF